MNDLQFRPFGHLAGHLDIDFDQTSRPQLVTQILQSCTVHPTDVVSQPAFFWELTVGKRIEYLLRIAILGDTSNFTIPSYCQNQDCRQRIEVSFTLDELTSLQHQAEGKMYFSVRIGDRTLSFRKPTGNDQLMWQRRSFDSQKQVLEAMIRTLLFEPYGVYDNSPIPDEDIQIIGEVMQQSDPLVNLSFGVHCPYCEEEYPCEIDLEEIALRSLRHTQLRLIEDIHRLALHYHWREAEFFSLPSWRRTRYLALLEREGVL